MVRMPAEKIQQVIHASSDYGQWNIVLQYNGGSDLEDGCDTHLPCLLRVLHALHLQGRIEG